jgi:hypothetical protein
MFKVKDSELISNPKVISGRLSGIINKDGITEDIIKELKEKDFLLYRSISGKLKLITPKMRESIIDTLINNPAAKKVTSGKLEVEAKDLLLHLQDQNNYLPINSDNLGAWAKEYNV